MIHFRTRQYKTVIDSSYFLKDGRELGNLTTFLLGDIVTISWPADAEKYNAIENINPRALGDDLYCAVSWGDQASFHMYTTCIVVERRRNLAHLEKGADLRDFGLTIVLEATNGYVEDMLLWLMLDERPVWARIDE